MEEMIIAPSILFLSPLYLFIDYALVTANEKHLWMFAEIRKEYTKED